MCSYLAPSVLDVIVTCEAFSTVSDCGPLPCHHHHSSYPLSMILENPTLLSQSSIIYIFIIIIKLAASIFIYSSFISRPRYANKLKCQKNPHRVLT